MVLLETPITLPKGVHTPNSLYSTKAVNFLITLKCCCQAHHKIKSGK